LSHVNESEFYQLICKAFWNST